MRRGPSRSPTWPRAPRWRRASTGSTRRCSPPAWTSSGASRSRRRATSGRARTPPGFHHDDALYREGLAAAERAQLASADAPWASDDPDLQLRTPAELKAEIERGLRVELEDFNPLRMMEPRK
jgi:hypothetical protein